MYLGLVCEAHSVHVAGERAQRVEDDEVAAGEGVDEAGTVALPQDVEDTGLVEVSEVDNVLHCVLVGWACLGRGKRGEGRGRQRSGRGTACCSG